MKNMDVKQYLKAIKDTVLHHKWVTEEQGLDYLLLRSISLMRGVLTEPAFVLLQLKRLSLQTKKRRQRELARVLKYFSILVRFYHVRYLAYAACL